MVKMNLKMLRSLCLLLLKEHKERGLSDFDTVNLETKDNGRHYEATGFYDCPPIYFKYRHGPETGWEWKKF